MTSKSGDKQSRYLALYSGDKQVPGAAQSGDNRVVMSRYLAPHLTSATFNVNSALSSGLFSFFSFLVLLSLLIPISLYVSVEFVKGLIANMISSDRHMWVEEEDVCSKAKTAGLCEELGQVRPSNPLCLGFRV